MIRLSLLGTMMFVLLLVMTACGNGDDADVEIAADVDVEEFEYFEETDGARVLQGVLVNLGDTDISSAQVEVVLLDEHNRQMSSAYIQVDEIKAGERTSFRKVLDRDEQFASARVKSVLVL